MKSVSDEWRSQPTRKRKKYETQAKKEKERYQRDTVLFTREFERMFGKDGSYDDRAAELQEQEDEDDYDEEQDEEEGEIETVNLMEEQSDF